MLYLFMFLAAACYAAAIHAAYLLQSARRDRDAALSRLRCMLNSTLLLLDARKHSDTVREMAESSARFDAAHARSLLQEEGGEEQAVRRMWTTVLTNTEIARLQRALRDCVTGVGAMAWNGHDHAERRLRAINDIAAEALKPREGAPGD